MWHLCVVETMVEQLSLFSDWRRLGVCTVHDSNDIGPCACWPEPEQTAVGKHWVARSWPAEPHAAAGLGTKRSYRRTLCGDGRQLLVGVLE